MLETDAPTTPSQHTDEASEGVVESRQQICPEGRKQKSVLRHVTRRHTDDQKKKKGQRVCSIAGYRPAGPEAGTASITGPAVVVALLSPKKWQKDKQESGGSPRYTSRGS